MARTNHWSVLTFVLFISITGVLALNAPAPANEPEQFELPAPDDRTAVAKSIREWLTGAWLSHGYSERDAKTLAERSLDRMRNQILPEFIPSDKINVDYTMSPDAEPTILIRNYLVDQGVSAEEATKYAIFAFLIANGRELSQEELDTGCDVYPVYIVYCAVDEFGQVRKKVTTGYFDALCWEEKILPLLPKQLPVCESGFSPYFELPFDCLNAEGCAWIRYDGEFGPIPCEMENFSCACLEPPPTETIGVICCRTKGGCQTGCPNCSGHE